MEVVPRLFRGELLHSRRHPLLRNALDDAGPLLVVVAARGLRPLAVVAQQVLDSGALAARVERVAGVREGQEEDAARTQHAQEVVERGDRVLHVLEHVVCDHEVERRVLELREPLAVVDHVGRHEWPAVDVELPGVELAQLVRAGMIHVADAGLRRNAQRHVERADLDPVAAQVAEGQIVPGRLPARWARAGDQVTQLEPRSTGEAPAAGEVAKHSDRGLGEPAAQARRL